jgi:enoyl-[acyl-carrier protein] reductase I
MVGAATRSGTLAAGTAMGRVPARHPATAVRAGRSHTTAAARDMGSHRAARAGRRAASPGATAASTSGLADQAMAVLSDKVGLIVGIANKRSIAWAIAQAAATEGASLVVTHQNARLEENVRDLAASLSDPLLLPCDVTDDAQLDALFEAIRAGRGRLDFVVHGAAFADRIDLDRPFVETSREGFHKALDVSTYSLVALARRAAPLMTSGGSILTLSYLGASRVFPNYNVMGVAKAALEASVRYLASDLGPQNIRVNAISAGAIRTLASSGISGFSSILQTYRDRAPLRRAVDAAEVADAAVCLLGPAGRAITGEVIMVDAGFHAMGL